MGKQDTSVQFHRLKNTKGQMKMNEPTEKAYYIRKTNLLSVGGKAKSRAKFGPIQGFKEKILW